MCFPFVLATEGREPGIYIFWRLSNKTQLPELILLWFISGGRGKTEWEVKDHTYYSVYMCVLCVYMHTRTHTETLSCNWHRQNLVPGLSLSDFSTFLLWHRDLPASSSLQEMGPVLKGTIKGSLCLSFPAIHSIPVYNQVCCLFNSYFILTSRRTLVTYYKTVIFADQSQVNRQSPWAKKASHVIQPWKAILPCI